MFDAVVDLDLEPRLFRAFAAALCRRVEHLLPHPVFVAAIGLVERWAAGDLPDDERWAACARLGAVLESLPGYESFNRGGRPDAGLSAASAVHFALWSDDRRCHGTAEGAGYVMLKVATALGVAGGRNWESDPDGMRAAERAEMAVQAGMLRAALGNPFRGPVGPAVE
jgi:hypothetical protein